MKKICFTGYRPFKLPFKITNEDKGYLSFRETAKNVIISQIERGNLYYISGMAQGADIILAGIISELKVIYSGLLLECALPFKCQAEKWNIKQKNCYDSILASSDKITVLSESYCKNGYIIRNKYMVDSSTAVIAVYDGKRGGTKFTLDYAAKKGREIIIINPLTNQVYIQERVET